MIYLTFCAIFEAQNTDNATTFRMWSSGNKFRDVYAITDFIIIVRM